MNDERYEQCRQATSKSNEPRRGVPVVPYALGSISLQTVDRVTTHNHTAIHDALETAMAERGYRLVATSPTGIIGLQTMTFERVVTLPSPQLREARRQSTRAMQASLAESVAEAWEQAQHSPSLRDDD
jgi:hypothetical protein